MKAFLQYVAEDLTAHFGTDLHRVCVVFPGKRASLFFNECLAMAVADSRPLWSPAYTTISELMRSLSPLVVPSDVRLVCELYRVFCQVTGSDETIDHFYGWGQRLLADFDDIDKNMAPAERLFSNLSDIHELDQTDYLTPEQRRVIAKFFSTVADWHEGSIRERFLTLWSRLGDIYREFRLSLREQKLAYEGMLYRDVANDGLLCPKEAECYAFVGFNLVQPAQQALFHRLQAEGRATFYWDFDHYYTQGDHEAGNYIKQYLNAFPNQLNSRDEKIYGNFLKPKEITLVGSPGEDLEARYVGTWLSERERGKAGRRTAIVLCNEELLPTIVHCIPPGIGGINCTGGYPLSLSPIYSLLTSLIALPRLGLTARRCMLRTIEEHPYSPYFELPKGEIGIDKLLSVIEQIAKNYGDADDFTCEALFRAYTLLQSLRSEAEAGRIEWTGQILGRIVRQLFRTTKIALHGEPLAGVQVMGVLETRNLDFDHVLILSCDENNMPPAMDDASFIPYTLRKAYGLTTIDNKTALYSYYFHRLISRTSDLTIAYCNATTGLSSGEMSPFMLQLLAESGHQVRNITLEAAQANEQIQFPEQPKDEPTLQCLNNLEHLSPSAINSYLRCPMQFYFRTLRRLPERQDDDPASDPRVFGNIFHRAAQLIYESSPRLLKAEDIGRILDNPMAIECAVDRALRDEIGEEQPDGGMLIVRQVEIKLLTALLRLDLRRAPFTLLSTEQKIYQNIQINTPLGKRNIEIGGIIDRIDQKDDCLVVIDYKTGQRKFANDLADYEMVFSREPQVIAGKHSDYYLQTLLYSSLLLSSSSPLQGGTGGALDGLPVVPQLLFIQHASAPDYDPTLTIGKQKLLLHDNDLSEFRTRLRDVLEEIFNPNIPFTPRPNERICSQCSYANLCRRIKKPDYERNEAKE